MSILSNFRGHYAWARAAEKNRTEKSRAEKNRKEKRRAGKSRAEKNRTEGGLESLGQSQTSSRSSM